MRLNLLSAARLVCRFAANGGEEREILAGLFLAGGVGFRAPFSWEDGCRRRRLGAVRWADWDDFGADGARGGEGDEPVDEPRRELFPDAAGFVGAAVGEGDLPWVVGWNDGAEGKSFAGEEGLFGDTVAADPKLGPGIVGADTD